MRLFFPILFILFYRVVFSQSPGYLHYDIEDGLPSNLIYCAIQDREGYLWFGTDKGLARFDGEHFKTYTTLEGLPDPEVINLYEDFYGRLWIGCFSTKAAYRLGGQFFTAKNDTLLKSLSLSLGKVDFFEERDSTLWILSGRQALIRNNKTFKHDDLRLNMRIEKMYSIDTILLGLYGNMVFKIEPTGKFKELYHFKLNTLSRSRTISQNRFLLTFSDSTRLVEYLKGKISLLTTSPLILEHVYTDRQGRFWGCSPGKGAVLFNNADKDLSNPVWHLPGKKITNIYEDRQGNFWFLTHGQGLFLLPKNQAVSWKKANSLSSSNILSLALDTDGAILAGDDLGNVHRFSGGKHTDSFRFGAFTGVNLVRRIVPKRRGQFWVVTDAGFYFQNKQKFEPHNLWLIKDNLKNPAAAPKTMIPTNEGAYWFGSSWGLGVLKPDQKLPVLYRTGRVTALVCDQEDNVWKGGIDGFFSQRDSFTYNWGERFPLLKSRITVIQPGNTGRLWVVTSESGLLDIQIKGGKVLAVTQVNPYLNAPIKDIKNLRSMPDGTIWIATNRGVFFVDNQWNTINYTTKNGLASNEVNDVLVLNDSLWAATADGLSVLDLQNVERPPDFCTILTEFRYQMPDSTLQIDFSGKAGLPLRILLPNNARLPEACFAGLNRLPGDIIYYRHLRHEKLLPFPWYTIGNLINWIGDSFQPNASFDTLILNTHQLNFGASPPPGYYEIQSTALTLNGMSSVPVIWELIIMPHWTQTIWPWLFIMALAGGWFWRFYRMRTKFFRLETDVLQFKLQAIRAQINPHFVGNSINAIQKFFYPPNPEQASEYIHLFTVLLRKSLLLSEKNFIPFSEEIIFDQEYLTMVKLRYADQFKFEITGTQNILSNNLLYPAMILQPILENATLHGLAVQGVSQLSIHFEIKSQQLICTVTDNGPGIQRSQDRMKVNPTTRVSKGITLLENKVRMLNTLHNINLKIEWTDLSETKGEQANGTQASISLNLITATSLPFSV
ncbi:MAG: two-component regulator propeller domain-containing protein [Saprospiraceae bacterium]